MSYTNITKDLNESESLFEMTNLTPKRTGLNVIILSEQNTEIKNESSKEPKFKIIGKDYSISYSLEENPKILAKSGKIKHSDIKDIEDAIDYVIKTTIFNGSSPNRNNIKKKINKAILTETLYCNRKWSFI